LSLKKTLRASELEREDIINSRKAWEEFQRSVDPSRLVFLVGLENQHDQIAWSRI
jgi:hypothetical protein